MDYLFGFSGRIGRAQMWLFLVVTVAWLGVNGFLLVLGWNWHECIEDCQSAAFIQVTTGPKVGWLIVFLVLTASYVLSLAAVCTKRLHDRRKSGWWLVLYLAIPCALGTFGREWSVAMALAALLVLAGTVELFLLPGTDGLNDYDPP